MKRSLDLQKSQPHYNMADSQFKQMFRKYANTLDYQYVLEIVKKRGACAQESALKGILKEQGLHKDWINKLMEAFRDEQHNVSDTVLRKAMDVAKELDIRDDCMDMFLQLITHEQLVDVHGCFDEQKTREVFVNLLKQFPMLKQKKHITIIKMEI